MDLNKQLVPLAIIHSSIRPWSMRFLHTADWQIGKPFQSIEDHAKREALRQQRLDTVRNLKALIDSEHVDFVLVCGDLFDSATPDTATVSGLCSAIGSLEVPVYAIPGNHDHGGPGCIWEQDFYKREQSKLAPNFHILLEARPVNIGHAVLLPCPLLRRHESNDPTAWLRSEPTDLPDGLPRIVLAHGSTQGFSSFGDSDSESSINRIELKRLPEATYDYIALGDWHGMKEIGPGTWFSGTPEQDRFAKGKMNQPGYVCIVDIQTHGKHATVTPRKTGTIGWHCPDDFHVTNDTDLDTLETQLETLLGRETNRALLKLNVHGTLSYTGVERFEALAESFLARLIRLDLDRYIQEEPSQQELSALTERQDPLITQVALQLRNKMETEPLARDALRELHLLSTKPQE